MLPPGHMAAGYLVAYFALKAFKPELTTDQINFLPWLGGFLAFIPDLDIFCVFYRSKSLTINPREINHRKFITHTPFFWLIIGWLFWYFSAVIIWKWLGILIWLAVGSHLILDTLQCGIKWLWPFSGKLFALHDPGVKIIGHSRGFWKYWLDFLNDYLTEAKLTFYTELVLVGIFVAVVLNNL